MDAKLQFQIQKAIQERIEITGSQTEVAASLGISDAHLINIRRGEFGKVSDRLLLQIANRLNINSGWNTAETADFKRIAGLCAEAQAKSISKAICFAPGSGKTYALRAYAAASKNVFYVECEEYWNRKVFLGQLKQAMGIGAPSGSVHDMVMEIIERLNSIETPLVIIDEADKLADGVLNFYKTLYNKTRCGFILCGAPYFQKRIDRGVRSQKQAYQEIYSRFGKEYIPLRGVNERTVREICHANGIAGEQHVMRVWNSSMNDLRRVRDEIEKIRLETAVL